MREKAAALIQDWAEAIRLSPYRDTYAELQSKGVDFPPRDPARLSPIHTPPQTAGLGGMSEADAAAIAAAALPFSPLPCLASRGTFPAPGGPSQAFH